ncbi:25kDa protein [Agapanthus velarivirus]|nr:25kDa protein [Agapanthus velarivirus]
MINTDCKAASMCKQKVALLHELVDFIDEKLSTIRALHTSDLRTIPNLISELTDCRTMLIKLGDMEVGLLAKRLRYFMRDNLPVSGDWLEENTATATVAVSTTEITETITRILSYLTLLVLRSKSQLVTVDMVRNIDSRHTYADSTADIMAALKRDMVNRYESYYLRAPDIEIHQPIEREFAASIRRIYAKSNFTEPRKIQALNAAIRLSFEANSTVFGFISLKL